VNFAPGKIPLEDKSPDNVYIVYKPRRRPNVVLSFLHHCFMSSSTDHSNVSHPMPYRTACLQYSQLTHTPSPIYLLFTRPRTLCSRCPLLLAFLFLSGDIELNPGPVSFTLCTLNICSILHPLHSAALSDLIDAHNTDLFCLTETWIKPTTTSAELLNCTPSKLYPTQRPSQSLRQQRLHRQGHWLSHS